MSLERWFSIIGKFGLEFRNFRLTARRKTARGENSMQEKGKLARSLPFHHGSSAADAEAARTQGTKGEFSLRATSTSQKGSVSRTLEQPWDTWEKKSRIGSG